MLSVISECYICGVVTAPLKLKYCQLSGKAVKRPGQKHGAHDMTSPRWDDVSSICSCGSQISPPPTPTLPLGSCRLHAEISDSRVLVGNRL